MFLIVSVLTVSVLTGCTVAAHTPTSTAHSGEPSSSPQIGGPVASASANSSAPSIVDAGSFPRSFLIQGTDTSIRIGGS
jgi:hypothetical protein